MKPPVTEAEWRAKRAAEHAAAVASAFERARGEKPPRGMKPGRKSTPQAPIK